MAQPAEVSATIEEQRARLPPAPEKCADEVEGTWMSLKYSPHYHPPQWYEVTIEIKRTAPGSELLEGSMLVRYWFGGPGDAKPPACKPGGYDRFVFQPSVGKITTDGQLRVDATSWSQREVRCGGEGYRGYNLDHYAGKIDPVLKEFQSVNNDGGIAVNEPAVFRRIRCPAPGEVDNRDKKSNISVKPPSFVPARSGGCGRGW
jgi:hypothetical protein